MVLLRQILCLAQRLHRLHFNVLKVHIKINVKLFPLPGTYEADILVRSDSFYSLKDSNQCQSHSLLPHKNMKTYNAIQICLMDTHGLKKEMFHFFKVFLHYRGTFSDVSQYVYVKQVGTNCQNDF